MRRTFLIAMHLIAQVAFTATGAWAVGYQIRNIDSLIPYSPYGGTITAINDNGQIVGRTYVDPSGRGEAFLSQEGMPIQDMGILGCVPVPYDLNNNGQAVGTYRTYVSAVGLYCTSEGRAM